MAIWAVARLLQTLALLVLLILDGVASLDGVQLSDVFGGPHGTEFSDESSAVSGQTVGSITIRAGERVDGVSLEITAPTAISLSHGGDGGDPNTLTLGEGEYITSMEAHWAKKNDHTRIFYLSFGTSAGNFVSGGSKTDDNTIIYAPEGYQLSAFFGRDGDEIDQLGAIWTSIEVVVPATEAPAPSETAAPATSTDPATVAPAGSASSDQTTTTSKVAIQLSDVFGGPHGTQFSDQSTAASGQTVGSVTIRAGERVDGLSMDITAPTAFTLTHGGDGGDPYTLTLGADEYITSMEVHWGAKNGHTRIFYLNFGTSTGNSVSGGSKTDLNTIIYAPEGYQLSAFFGREGDEIDQLGAIWTSIEVVETTSDAAGSAPNSPSDIQLSAVFGGPHGTAFSDINSVEFGETASAITVRSGERVDGVSLELSAPTVKLLSHGGSGGDANTLTLGDGEYITSMEAHWGKKNDHTRVFYLSFGTSAGNFVSGGTKTDDNSIIYAPDGFQLSGFFGRDGDEIDQLGVIWMSRTATGYALDDLDGSGSGTYGTTIRNWVGPTIGAATDTACYRKTKPASSTNACPTGYGYDDDNDDCDTQCPMAYPVECAAECIPQNDDCALEILTKIWSVAMVAINAATAGVFGEILAAYKAATLIYNCATNMISVAKSLTYYLRYTQTTAPQGDTEQLLAIAYQSDVVLVDIPIAVCTCLGLPVPANAKYVDQVITVVENVVKQIVTNGDEIMADATSFMNFLTDAGATVEAADDTSVTDLTTLMDSGSTCGYELKRLTDRVVAAVNDIRSATPDATVDDIRVTVSTSSIAMTDVPTVTNNCMGELLATKTVTAAYETRDLLRKTFGVIFDQLIETSTTDLGESVSSDDYMLEIANTGLTVLSGLDPTGIAYMMSQFVQPICGPTAYLGEIDDGSLFDALGLTTVDEAFEGSYGTWTKEGDGIVELIFESTDTKDVSVVIHSGGDVYYEVDVGSGDTVTWTSTIKQLQDKTMYLDRWRPGLFGLPGTGGGSLLLWVPRAAAGGHLQMHVRINVS